MTPVSTGARAAFPRSALERSIPELFERQAAVHADRPAIVGAGESVTYAQLESRANRVARAVRDAGVSKGAPVALFVRQGVPHVTALLAVLKAGGFFVSLDPGHPDARNTRILADSGAALLVTDAAGAARARRVGAHARILVLDDVGEGVPGGSLRGEPAPDAPACLLYTSGSTGDPKGVLHDHATLLHNTLRHADVYEIVPDDRLSLLYPCGVYGGTRDIFNALLSGASLHHYEFDALGVRGLPRWVSDERITIYCSAATVFRRFTRAIADERFPAMRVVKLGGERVLRGDVELFRRHFGASCRLSCGLASTETGAVRQVLVDPSSTTAAERITCGFAVPDVDVRIVDEDGGEVADGTTGEIVASSRYLARRYWRRPELTAARFSDAGHGVRTFRTGDFGRILPDGQLVHEGRRDLQVKVLGNRIEVEEVEAALRAHPAIAEACVSTAERVPGETRLCAHVVTDGACDARGIRAHLDALLPPPMVPSLFVFVDGLPTLPSGKVDRAALQRALPDAPTGGPTAARNEVERRLLRIWGDVLETAPPGIHADFFESGGDSLRLVELALRIEDAFGIRFPLADVGAAPTVALMAERIATGGRQRDAAPRTEIDGVETAVLPIQPDGTRPPLFFVAPAGGSVLPYYLLAHLLGDDQPFFGLQVTLTDRRRNRSLSVEALARQFLPDVRRVQPAGPLRLGGWSFGGFVAYAMAVEQRRAGRDVERLLLVDADRSMAGVRRSLGGALRSTRLLLQMLAAARPFLRNRIHMRLAAARRDPEAGRRPLRRLLLGLLWRDRLEDPDLGDALARNPHLAELARTPRGVLRDLRRYVRAIRDYDPPSLDVDVDLFRPEREGRALLDPSDPRWTHGWHRTLDADVHVHALTGNHFTLFQRPHLDGLAAAIREATGDRPQRPARGRS